MIMCVPMSFKSASLANIVTLAHHIDNKLLVKIIKFDIRDSWTTICMVSGVAWIITMLSRTVKLIKLETNFFNLMII